MRGSRGHGVARAPARAGQQRRDLGGQLARGVKWGAVAAPVGQAAAQLPQAWQWAGSTEALSVTGSRVTAW